MSRRGKNVLGFLILTLIALNIVACFHAYKFTHFSTDAEARTDPKELTFFGKLETFAFGVDNPRPANTDKPSRAFETVEVPHDKDTIACWHVPVDDSKGTVLIFHGYAGNRSQMVKESDQFNELGYTTILVDFLGSGGSTGNKTTIGFYESEQVKKVFDFFKKDGQERASIPVLFCSAKIQHAAGQHQDSEFFLKNETAATPIVKQQANPGFNCRWP